MALFQIQRIPSGPLLVNCYVVSNPATLEAVIVDPGGNASHIIQECAALHPCAVLLTHGHFDHFGGTDTLCGHYHIPLYVHEADIPLLKDPEKNVSAPFGLPMVVKTQPVPIHGGDVLRLAGLEFTVIHTPGHTPGGVCYRLPENGGLLSGDTLMAHGYGRVDFYGGDPRQLMDSLRILFHLTPRMKLYPGHDEMGTVGRNEGEKPCSL